ncbi:hypothetical protein Pmani_031051 [Petrolisthes manimaculis]|uniref:Uncharacterized protein n=1 Tax=Petrolisthes manimaculis TaxID=1843537 RepID=A0AAE1NWH8_9EUCA|nr:hypothetical protein Pmani_031051 [Petrolisthes manimaculis]
MSDTASLVDSEGGNGTTTEPYSDTTTSTEIPTSSQSPPTAAPLPPESTTSPQPLSSTTSSSTSTSTSTTTTTAPSTSPPGANLPHPTNDAPSSTHSSTLSRPSTTSESIRRDTTVGDDGGDSAIKFLQINKHWIIVGVVAALLLLTIIQASITIHKAKKNKSPPVSTKTAPAPGAIDTGSRVALVGAGNGRGAPPPYDPASAFQSSVSIPSHTPSPSGTPLSTENPGFIAD